jgi:lauroyl/myristoyl acyltransferase
MNAIKKARLAGEVLLVRLGMLLVPFLPRRLVCGLARVGGALSYCLARQARHIALANLDLAFRDTLTPSAKQAIARQAFSTMAGTVLDMFWFSRDTRRRLARCVSADPQLRSQVYTMPIIGVTAHFGSWELLSRWLVHNDYPHAAVVAPLINPGVERLFQRSREADGMEVIPQAGALRGILTALRRKKNIALALDQNVRPEDGGVFVDFFGLPVPMSGGPAIFAERTGTPVIALFCLRRPDGTYYVYALPPLRPESLTNTRATTQAVAGLFEQEIRKHPEQWLWMYKRWKHVPPGRSPAEYPFYAKPLKPGK